MWLECIRISLICLFQTSLQKAAALAEETSEAIAEVFLSGTMDAETFLTSYTASRTVKLIKNW